MDQQANNPPQCSYTKSEIRLLLKNPNVDLTRPGNTQPVSSYYLTKHVKKVISRLQAKEGSAPFDLAEWNSWRIVPAKVCKLILTPLI